jgi:hypothetical protein
MNQFKGDEPLIVVHGDHGVKSTGGCLVKNCIRRPGARYLGILTKTSNRRSNEALLLIPEHPLLAGMGIEPTHGYARSNNPKISLERIAGGADAFFDLRLAQQATDPLQGHMNGH